MFNYSFFNRSLWIWNKSWADFCQNESVDQGSVLSFSSHESDEPEMHLKSLGIKISTLRSFITPGWYRYTFLNERLGMFYKAARSRAQANGKVGLNHRSIRHLKVKRQSFIIWGEVTGEWQEAGRGQGTFWSCRLSISGHMLAGVIQTVSEILLNVSSNLPGGLQHLNTTFNRLVMGKQAQSVTEILSQMTHTFHLRQCS